MRIDLVKYYMTSESFKKKLNNFIYSKIPKGYIAIDNHARKDKEQNSKDKNSITS